MRKWLATVKPDNRGGSLRTLQNLSNERITRVADQYFTNLWSVGGSQGRGAPSIEYRDRQKDKQACVKTFVEKHDMVTDPSDEHGQRPMGSSDMRGFCPEMVLALATDIYGRNMLIDDKDTPMYTPSQSWAGLSAAFMT